MSKYKKWNNEDLTFIQNNASTLSDQELALKLSEMVGHPVTTSMIRRQRRKLNIQKPKGRKPKNKPTTLNSSEFINNY
jgi:hypothetical protein